MHSSALAVFPHKTCARVKRKRRTVYQRIFPGHPQRVHEQIPEGAPLEAEGTPGERPQAGGHAEKILRPRATAGYREPKRSHKIRREHRGDRVQRRSGPPRGGRQRPQGRRRGGRGGALHEGADGGELPRPLLALLQERLQHGPVQRLHAGDVLFAELQVEELELAPLRRVSHPVHAPQRRHPQAGAARAEDMHLREAPLRARAAVHEEVRLRGVLLERVRGGAQLDLEHAPEEDVRLVPEGRDGGRRLRAGEEPHELLPLVRGRPLAGDHIQGAAAAAHADRAPEFPRNLRAGARRQRPLRDGGGRRRGLLLPQFDQSLVLAQRRQALLLRIRDRAASPHAHCQR